MGIFSEKTDTYRVVKNEYSRLNDNNKAELRIYYTIEQKYDELFGGHSWKTMEDWDDDKITFSKEEDAGEWIKMTLHKSNKEVVRVYETRDTKIGKLLDDA